MVRLDDRTKSGETYVVVQRRVRAGPCLRFCIGVGHDIGCFMATSRMDDPWSVCCQTTPLVNRARRCEAGVETVQVKPKQWLGTWTTKIPPQTRQVPVLPIRQVDHSASCPSRRLLPSNLNQHIPSASLSTHLNSVATFVRAPFALPFLSASTIFLLKPWHSA